MKTFRFALVSYCSSSGTQEVMTEISIYLVVNVKKSLKYHKLLLSSPWYSFCVPKNEKPLINTFTAQDLRDHLKASCSIETWLQGICAGAEQKVRWCELTSSRVRAAGKRWSAGLWQSVAAVFQMCRGGNVSPLELPSEEWRWPRLWPGSPCAHTCMHARTCNSSIYTYTN